MSVPRKTVRPIKIVRNYVKHAEGSCLFSMGQTRVLCVASLENKRPPHAEEKNIGWVTAEYAMLPRAGDKRTQRSRAQNGGRAQEISRLLGRSFRAVVDLAKLGANQVTIDCDVLQADGGTRTAAINGGMIALADALKHGFNSRVIPAWPLTGWVGAVSAGLVDQEPVLDLNFELDQKADCDVNFVMTASGKLVEVQGTAEGATFSEKQFLGLMRMAQKGIGSIIQKTKKSVGRLPGE